MSIAAIVTCVNYADILDITLPRMLEHFAPVTIVTDMRDSETAKVVFSNGAELFRTDAFYKRGAKFNKGAAMELALQSAKGWTCILDADIVLPKEMPLDVEIGYLYSPYRRLLEKPGPIPPESDWSLLPEGWERTNGEFAGYFQLFHTDDPRLGKGPWYEYTEWTTAQGCDSYFYYRWRPDRLKRLPFEVLHLGELRVNWSGRVSERWHRRTDSE